MLITSSAPEETVLLGRKVAKNLPPPCVLCLYGDLGAGKTTFLKGLLTELTKEPESEIKSPTFTFLRSYEGQHGPIHHFDLYRLSNANDFLAMDFLDLLEEEGAISLIEWPERIKEISLPNHYKLHIYHKKENVREISLPDSLYKDLS